MASDLLKRRQDDSEHCRVGRNARVQDKEHTEPQSSASPTLQDTELIAVRGNTSPSFQKTDPSCSGVMTLTYSHDLISRGALKCCAMFSS